MRVVNVHERKFNVPPMQLGALIDTLASPQDKLWPIHIWPPMKFDRSLAIGAIGGHGPIRYKIEEYQLGEYIKFRFLAPEGFDGFHEFQLIKISDEHISLRHTIEMTTHGLAVFSWMLFFRPLHDALIEDLFAHTEACLNQKPNVVRWSLWVRFLRWIFSSGKAKSQRTPNRIVEH